MPLLGSPQAPQDYQTPLRLQLQLTVASEVDLSGWLAACLAEGRQRARQA